MRKSKFSESQIVGMLKEAESGPGGGPAATARHQPHDVLQVAE